MLRAQPPVALPACGLTVFISFESISVFSRKKPSRALKFFPHFQPFPLEKAGWKSCSAQRSPKPHSGLEVGNGNKKQTSNFDIKCGPIEPQRCHFSAMDALSPPLLSLAVIRVELCTGHGGCGQ